MMGAKCEAEIISSVVVFFQMTRVNAFLFFYFLIWTSAWNDLQLLRLSVSDCALLL